MFAPTSAPAVHPAPPAEPAARWPHASALVVGDEEGMRNFLGKTLAARVGQVLAAASAEGAERLLERHRFDLLILHITLPGRSGIPLLQDLRARGHPGEVVLTTAFADLDTAIEALRAGACDFLAEPFRVTQVLDAVRQGLERARLKRQNWLLRRALMERTPPTDRLVGRSIVVRGLRAALQRVAAIESTMLLAGDRARARSSRRWRCTAWAGTAAAPSCR